MYCAAIYQHVIPIDPCQPYNAVDAPLITWSTSAISRLATCQMCIYQRRDWSDKGAGKVAFFDRGQDVEDCMAAAQWLSGTNATAVKAAGR
jgi:hypothetical protein